MNGMREYRDWLATELEFAREDLGTADDFYKGIANGLQMAHDAFKKYTIEKED